MLPAEYGGTNGTVEELQQFWEAELPRHREFLARQSQYTTQVTQCLPGSTDLGPLQEDKRPGGPKTASDLFGSCCIM